MPISVLKNILFVDHVHASMISEKSELVTLIDDERRGRERYRLAKEAERFKEERRRERQQEEERSRKERRKKRRVRVEGMDIEVEVSEDGHDDDEPVSSVGLTEFGGVN